jgi:hypothetical protein
MDGSVQNKRWASPFKVFIVNWVIYIVNLTVYLSPSELYQALLFCSLQKFLLIPPDILFLAFGEFSVLCSNDNISSRQSNIVSAIQLEIEAVEGCSAR